MIYYAMASERDFVADMIYLACKGWGCDETILVELFVMCEQEWLKQGKAAWEGRNDTSLIDRLTKELEGSYKHLLKLLLMLLKGDVNNEDMEADDEAISAQVEAIHAEVSKSRACSPASPTTRGCPRRRDRANNTAQNCRLAGAREHAQPGAREGAHRQAPAEDRVVSELAAAAAARLRRGAHREGDEGVGHRQDHLVRLPAASRGGSSSACSTRMSVYGLPLASALNQEVDVPAKACLTWIRALDDPAGGMEVFTDGDVAEHKVTRPS